MTTPFPQILTVLFDTPPTLDAVGTALARVGATPRPQPRGEGWVLGHPGVMVPGTDDRPGVFVDIVPAPWPDGMGARGGAPALRAAAAQGAFGPAPAPGALARAATHAAHWPEAPAAIATHQAFLRLRTSPMFPGTSTGPAATWRHLTGLAALLMALPGATAWFAPQGEVLHASSTLVASIQEAARDQRHPIDLWTGLRLFRMGDPDGWAVMDTVGMAILGGVDVELCFRPALLDPREAGAFVRNASLYLLQGDKQVSAGHTLEGPGIKVQALAPPQALVPPGRPVLRLVPVGGRPLPPLLQVAPAEE